MDTDGNSKDDVKVPDSTIGQEIEKAFEEGKDLMVTIIAAMGGYIRIQADDNTDERLDEEQAISWKEAPAEKA
jgi:translation initiation factor 5A